MYISAALIITAAAVIPGRAAAAACNTPVTSSSVMATALPSAYATWKNTYVVSGGNDTLRVQRSAGDNHDTVSEGIAYGMLFAAYSNDKPTFDGLWRYAKNHLNINGVMNWRIAADGSTTGWNGATDADEDMAAALIAADTQWGGYRTEAMNLISTIKKYEVEPGTNVLKPGDAWGGSDLLNPSYLTPSYYTAFATYTGDSSWNDVRAASYRVFDAITAKSDAKKTGFVPDWSRADGTSVSGMSFDYGYDGSRAPLRLAMAANWDCDAKATGLLAALNATNASRGVTTLRSSYALSGPATGNSDGTPLLAAAAVSATVSDDQAFRERTWNALVDAPSTGYFGDSMRLFGLFVASGTLTSPLALKKTAPAAETPVVTNAFAMNAPVTTAVTGIQTTVAVDVSAPTGRSNMLVDLEVYDVNGTRLAQKFYENVSLSPSATAYTIIFTPPANGTYTVKGGVFTAGWASNLLWNGSITTVTAAPAVVPVPTTPVTPVTPAADPMPASQPTPAPVTPAPSSPVTAPLPTLAPLSIWWPGSTQAVSGVQPFKAVLDGTPVSQYAVYWQVDGGTLNAMGDVDDGAPHKESLVDLNYWTWRDTGKYTVNFVAKNTAGTIITQKSVVITVR